MYVKCEAGLNTEIVSEQSECSSHVNTWNYVDLRNCCRFSHAIYCDCAVQGSFM